MCKRFIVTILAMLLVMLACWQVPFSAPIVFADPGTQPKCPPNQNCK
jgi:hypothetical protein